MRTITVLTAVMAILVCGSGAAYAHCGHCGVGEPAGVANGEGDAKGAVEKSLCGKCGEIKGSENCCKEAAACEKCGLHKGAPGCCKMHAGDKDATLCSKCGEIKGAEGCCKEGAPRCGHCGLIKGTPGCCAADPKPAEEAND